MSRIATWSVPARWVLALTLAALCFGVLGGGFALLLLDWRFVPLVVVLPVVMAPLESLLLTPLYTLTGRFRYFSPMLFATRRRDGGLDLHAGTLFDYVMWLRWSDRGPRAARIVAVELLRGLYALAGSTEAGLLPPSATISATSHFFGERTMRRFGFDVRQPAAGVVGNLLLAWLSITVRLSFTRGRLAFPDLRRVRQAVTTVDQLAHHRDAIASTLARLVLDGVQRHLLEVDPG